MKKIDSFVGEYRFLSNFAPSVIEVDGFDYPTVEHAFQALKTENPTEREIVRTARTPGQAKKLGRRVTLRADWNTARVSVMKMLLEKKFSNKVLRAELLATEDAELVEGNYWNDTFWGVCRGRGENNLGRLLMEVRSSIKK
jgi:ribA/ribD-fused uncharacterized protein